jgi:ABC-type transport system involved in cytochrome c biogenesis permease subunit
MDPFGTLGLWVVGLCLVAGLVGLAAWLRPGVVRLERSAAGLGLVCFVVVLGGWLARWRIAGHLPLFGTFESSLSLALAVLLSALVVWSRSGRRAAPWPIACGVSAALVAHGFGFDRTVYALTISESSWVVDLHALCAWAAFGVLAINAGFALHRILVGGEEALAADRRLAWSLGLGFLFHTAMMVTGSFYKFLLFGRAWSFDPIETLGLVAWLAYGTLLHMQLLAGWGGRRLAVWCLSLFVLLIVSYRGIVYFPAWSTYHIFDMDLRIHVTGVETEKDTR